MREADNENIAIRCSLVTLSFQVCFDNFNATIGGKHMNGQNRKDIRPGLEVEIVQKQDQRSGKRTRGIVKDILTNSASHPHGIKVRLETGEVGRVQEIIEDK
jgi:uncharacterized repeat protein (TIGR03833 family)